MKVMSIVKIFCVVLVVGSLNILATSTDLSDLDKKGLLDFLSGTAANTQSTDIKIKPVALRVDDSLVIEDLNSSKKCGNWDDWGYCPKRRIKAYEICTHNLYAKHLVADLAKIKNLYAKKAKIEELCCKKAKIEKLWADMISTDVLFAEKAKIDKLWAGQACAFMLCAHKGNIKDLLTDLTYTDSLYAEWADLNNVDAERIVAEHLCGCEIHAQKLCAREAIISDLKAIGNVELQTTHRAFVYNAVPITPYALGSDMKFDTVADDPDNCITQGTATTYTAPLSGGYILSLGITSKDLLGADTMSGQPINHPEIWVNGQHKVQNHLGYLSFSDEQNTLLTTLIHLNAGDVLTVRYNIRYIKAGSVEQYYVGTVDILGQNQNYSQETFLAIHYLSSDLIQYTPCQHDEGFDIQRPCIPPCCPCPMQNPPCEINCGHHEHHDGPCDDHDGHHGGHHEGPCDDHDGHHDGPCDDHDGHHDGPGDDHDGCDGGDGCGHHDDQGDDWDMDNDH